MHTNLLPLASTTQKLLQAQIELEHNASLRYLSMAIWADTNHYPHAAAFFYKQSEEERSHMLKVIQYLTSLDIAPQPPALAYTPTSYSSLKQIFQEAYQGEQKVTQAIHHLVAHTLAQKDFATFQFLQWFVEEQRHEEAGFRKKIDLFRVLEPQGLKLYTIDCAIAATTGDI